ASRAKRRQLQVTHVEGENPAPAHPPHLTCDRETDVVIHDRREARELADQVELTILERQLRRAPNMEMEGRVALASRGDPALHQVDSMALAGAILLESVQEVTAAGTDVE